MPTDPLHDAIRAGALAEIRALFGDAPEFPNVRDTCGSALLHLAIYHGPPPLVRALLAAGADPNAPADDGFPSLFCAIDREAADRHEILAALLNAGADVQQRGVNDYTPLHHAACRDDAKAVALLLARGADPAARTRIDHYATPLEEAGHFGHAVGAAALRAGTMPDEVAALLAALRHPREAEILAVRRIILDADPAIREGVKWNAPSYHVSEHFATFHLRGKSGIQVVLHRGAKARPGVRMPDHVDDPAGLLAWRGADRATVTFRDLHDVEAKRAAFATIVRQWIRHL